MKRQAEALSIGDYEQAFKEHLDELRQTSIAMFRDLVKDTFGPRLEMVITEARREGLPGPYQLPEGLDSYKFARAMLEDDSRYDRLHLPSRMKEALYFQVVEGMNFCIPRGAYDRDALPETYTTKRERSRSPRRH